MNDKTETPLWVITIGKSVCTQRKGEYNLFNDTEKRRDNIETSKIHLLVDSWTWPRAELYKKPHRFG